MTKIMQDILKLSVPERILMVEAIWDSIAENDEMLEFRITSYNVCYTKLLRWELFKNIPLNHI